LAGILAFAMIGVFATRRRMLKCRVFMDSMPVTRLAQVKKGLVSTTGRIAAAS
jgi:hypothetical protein